ncbi:hypothetical protein GCM10007874_04770 [Labrys miyagiensis]|uniref:Uncharacterized protein n=1 Tax=Labrys miyagiensis TaxID=346912 RepID=A0ABQ6CAP9_9HYPH|nr:hypothetical protein GCM10007874_04770 [Labrys miyagiensis]
MGIALGIDDGDAEMLRVDAGKLGNIGRDIAAVGTRGHLLGDLFHDLVKLGQGEVSGEDEATMQEGCRGRLLRRGVGLCPGLSWERGRPVRSWKRIALGLRKSGRDVRAPGN